MKQHVTPPDRGTQRRLAVAAECDPRTIVREYLAAQGLGSPARGMAGHRARRILIERGYLPPAANGSPGTPSADTLTERLDVDGSGRAETVRGAK